MSATAPKGILPRPSNGKAPRGMLRMPVGILARPQQGDAKGAPSTSSSPPPTAVSVGASASSRGGDGGSSAVGAPRGSSNGTGSPKGQSSSRFWEANRAAKSTWSAEQESHFATAREYIKRCLPESLKWIVEDREFQGEADALLSECLEICACGEPDEATPEQCLLNWLYACGESHYSPPGGSPGGGAVAQARISIPDLNSSDEFRLLRRKVEQLRTKIVCREDAPADRVGGSSEAEGSPTSPGSAQARGAPREMDRVIDPVHYQHFTCPKEFDPQEVPDQFESVAEWVSVVSSNILAEYWACIHALEAKAGHGGHKSWLQLDCEPSGASSAVCRLPPGVSPWELPHQLFRFSDDSDAIFRVITSSVSQAGQRAPAEGEDPTASTCTISFHPPFGKACLPKRRKAHLLAYIGTHMLEYTAISGFRHVVYDAASRCYTGMSAESSALLSSILRPSERASHLAEWGVESDAPLGGDGSAASASAGFSSPASLVVRRGAELNASQKRVVDGLKCCLEVIHGPPGTGKSTTVCNIITKRLDAAEKVLVTCTRNGAVDALASKLQGHVPILVVGSTSAMGAAAALWTVPAQLKRHHGLRQCEQILEGLETFADTISTVLAQHRARVKSRSRYALLHYCMRRRCPKIRLFLNIHEFVRKSREEATSKVQDIKKTISRNIWDAARVYVCTVSTSVRLYAEHAQCHDDSTSFTVPTVIVDECGSTSEAATAVLLRLKPQRLLLLGDHKQLPAFSLISNSDTNHAQSLMERVLKSSSNTEDIMLVEQYRMHPEVCALVSAMFYGKKLFTTDARAVAARSETLPALRWVEATTKEERTESHSFQNTGEAALIKQLLQGPLQQSVAQKKSVVVLAFYRAQCALLVTELEGLGAEVITTDSVQGREFDVVILSCVRNNKERDIGFLRDLPRMCVALSRAKSAVYIVGDSRTLSANTNWKQVCSYAGLAPERRGGASLQAAVGETRNLAREAGAVPEHIIPERHATAQQTPDTRADDTGCFVYFDPVQAQMGVYRPAAWHQQAALKAGISGGGMGPSHPYTNPVQQRTQQASPPPAHKRSEAQQAQAPQAQQQHQGASAWVPPSAQVMGSGGPNGQGMQRAGKGGQGAKWSGGAVAQQQHHQHHQQQQQQQQQQQPGQAKFVQHYAPQQQQQQQHHQQRMHPQQQQQQQQRYHQQGAYPQQQLQHQQYGDVSYQQQQPQQWQQYPSKHHEMQQHHQQQQHQQNQGGGYMGQPQHHHSHHQQQHQYQQHSYQPMHPQQQQYQPQQQMYSGGGMGQAQGALAPQPARPPPHRQQGPGLPQSRYHG